ncbi:Protein Virilizer [Manis pentadactyla]|nr:Protein Virilizer [Manis pentadactyla]
MWAGQDPGLRWWGSGRQDPSGGGRSPCRSYSSHRPMLSPAFPEPGTGLGARDMLGLRLLSKRSHNNKDSIDTSVPVGDGQGLREPWRELGEGAPGFRGQPQRVRGSGGRAWVTAAGWDMGGRPEPWPRGGTWGGGPEPRPRGGTWGGGPEPRPRGGTWGADLSHGRGVLPRHGKRGPGGRESHSGAGGAHGRRGCARGAPWRRGSSGHQQRGCPAGRPLTGSWPPGQVAATSPALSKGHKEQSESPPRPFLRMPSSGIAQTLGASRICTRGTIRTAWKAFDAGFETRQSPWPRRDDQTEETVRKQILNCQVLDEACHAGLRSRGAEAWSGKPGSIRQLPGRSPLEAQKAERGPPTGHPSAAMADLGIHEEEYDRQLSARFQSGQESQQQPRGHHTVVRRLWRGRGRGPAFSFTAESTTQVPLTRGTAGHP